MLTFAEYLGTLTRLGVPNNPLATTEDTARLRAHAASLAELPEMDLLNLSQWVQETPQGALTLALAAGLSAEKFKNGLKHKFDTSGYITLARERPEELISWMAEDFDLVPLLELQVHEEYTFGDILVARGGTKVTAGRAGETGRSIEDAIEGVAKALNLEYEVRTRFKGSGGDSAPADLLILRRGEPVIAVAAKGFDSTGSKLTDAVREMQEMVKVRTPMMFIMAAIDGIGWKSRQNDLRKIYDMRARNEIDGLYTLALMDEFQADLTAAARRLDLIS